MHDGVSLFYYDFLYPTAYLSVAEIPLVGTAWRFPGNGFKTKINSS